MVEFGESWAREEWELRSCGGGGGGGDGDSSHELTVRMHQIYVTIALQSHYHFQQLTNIKVCMLVA